MSGSIRMSLPSLVAGLQTQIKKAAEFEKRYGDDIPDNKRACVAFLIKVDVIKGNLELAKSKMQQKDQQWLAILDELATKDSDEYKRYQQFAYDGTQNLDPYMPLIEQANEQLTFLTVLQKQLNSEIDHYRNLEVQSHASSMQANAQPTGASNPPRVRVNLPKLVLPKFSGKINDWLKFKSLFMSNVDARSDLCDAEKFSYLLTLLEGDAAAVVDGLEVVDANYGIAVDQLKRRYDRTLSTRLTTYIAEFKQIPPASKDNKQKQVTFDQCERLFRQMEAAGDDLSNNRGLAMEFLSKFPPQMIRELDTHENVNVETPLSEIREKVFTYLMKSEIVSETIANLSALHPANEGTTSSKKSEKPKEQKPTKNQDNNQNFFWNNSSDSISQEKRIETSLLSQGNGRMTWVNRNRNIGPPGGNRQQPASPRPFICAFCEGDHPPSACAAYPSAESRRRRLDEINRCTACLGRFHTAKECKRVRRYRFCFHCQREHPSALCPSNFPDRSPGTSNGLKPGSSSTDPKSPNVGEQNKSVTFMTKTPVKPSKGQTLLMTAWCGLINPHTRESVEARVILDSGSSRDYITERVARRLNLQPESTEHIGVNVFGTGRAVDIKSAVVTFGLKLRDTTVKLVEANTTPLISNASVIPTELSPEEKATLQPFTPILADRLEDENGQIDVLLGAGMFWDIISGAPFRAENDLKLIPSKLGILLAGSVTNASQSESSLTTFLCVGDRLNVNNYPQLSILTPRNINDSHLKDVDEFWKLETIGITDDPARNDDDEAYEKFMKTIQYNTAESRYEVQFPWIEEKKCLLPTNYEGAKKRFHTLAGRLAANSTLRERYQAVLNLQIERGIIEEVPVEEIEAPKHATHYLPHRPVITDQKVTTKLRIVYDASARAYRGAPTLNECMYRGPIILPDMCEILIRFRTHRVGIIADVEKAFLQIGLQASERDVTRFFWFKDNSTTNPNEFTLYRFCRVLFGAIASPFLLGGTITYHLSSHKDRSDFTGQMAQDLFVDNEVTGVRNDMDAVKFYKDAKALFEKAGMNLQEWCSNSATLMKYISENDRVKKTDVKVLGISWDSSTDDTLRLTHSQWSTFSKCRTKREVMKAIATVYDPLGWFQPAVLPAKLFLQSLWQKKIEWDEQVESSDHWKWTEIHANISPIFEHKIQRYIEVDTANEVEVIAFSDASGQAFATAVYLRLRHGKNWSNWLVYAKSRLAPTGKTVTLPRLELLGLTISSAAAQFVRKSISKNAENLPKIHLFCDSSIVLSWLKTRKPLSRFVTNRIEPVRSVENVEFHYIQTKENPADKNTRGLPGSELIKDKLWWHGPRWLQQNQEKWPTHDLSSITTEELTEVENEVRHTAMLHSFLAGVPQEGETESVGIKRLINAERFSSLKKLLKTTVIVLKFIKVMIWNKLADETKARFAQNTCVGEISDTSVRADELLIAKRLWVKSIQRSDLKDVTEALTKRRRHKLVKQLGLKFDEDGVIRSYSRFVNSELPVDVKYPKLLPAQNYFTKLIVLDVHSRLYHVGEAHTLNQLRREFWIPCGRRIVKKTLRECLVCRRFDTKPFSRPIMPPFPKERIEKSAPFQFVGLDYFGPMNVKVGPGVTQKMWACLFTCLATRAIHLEWVLDCSSVEFRNCLSRYVSRRGIPELVISDNAPQFRIAKTIFDKLWSNILQSDEVQSFAAEKKIRWKFITELAPWQGGFYERMVGVVKNVLKRAIGRRVLWWQEFVTLLAEVEAIVNSRPLTYIHDDSEGKVLRPADFITDLPICEPSVSLETASPRDLGEAGRRLLSYWKRKQKYLDQLWTEWQNEYLNNLREKSTTMHRDPHSVSSGHPEVGDIVLVKDEDLSRAAWKLARVIKVITSEDGQVRSAEVILPNKCTIKRSVAHLYPLEVSTERPVVAVVREDPEEERNDEDQFFGFSETDVLRVAEALKRFPGDISAEDM